MSDHVMLVIQELVIQELVAASNKLQVKSRLSMVIRPTTGAVWFQYLQLYWERLVLQLQVSCAG